ncbi:MATE family efflux transporter [Cellulosilyticum sp. WCF-2]|uniref:MATE family efflux transporter n=1 Tax=Cellulosilyticum sp. WCF-2 TaxID=2497860 RepID=UPI0016809460|nr:MATE family efflux transporter [Cellulosilyticum sp. WCF-2]
MKQWKIWIDQYLTKELGSKLFTYRELFSMLLPIILDVFFVNIIGILTTAMVSSSSQESVSAVSLINPIAMMIYAVISALSTGGTVVTANYVGRGEKEKVKKTAGQVVSYLTVVGAFTSFIIVLFSKEIVRIFFTTADKQVMRKAEIYLIGVAISMIFLAIYMAVFAIFRGIGETRTCLGLTVLINLIHLIASFLFINIMNLDILGTVLSLNIARAIGAVVAIYMVMCKKGKIGIAFNYFFSLNKDIGSNIFKIGIPFAIEQILINMGGMLVQTFLVPLGTMIIAANAVTNSVLSILFAAGTAVGTLSMTIVGQCIGAGEQRLVKKYGKSMTKLASYMIILSSMIFLPLMPGILSLYKAPVETVNLIWKLILSTIIPVIFFWPFSSVLPCILRASGDSAYVSWVSLITMWSIRVLLGYLLTIPLGFGVMGLFIAMSAEWMVKSFIYFLRYRRINNRVLDD